MGHAYEKVVTDGYARWHRFLGDETYFLTGTDENGQKLQEAAKQAGLETKQFVDSNVQRFESLCHNLNISHDDFIRTTEKRHIEVCRELWLKLQKQDDLYFGTYSGKYCLACENFYTDLQAPDELCPHHKQPLSFKEEDGFFFKLSRYQEWILEYIKAHPDFILPRSSYSEVYSRLEKEPLKDVAFSRPFQGWGIPVPGHEKNFVMYTWADALVNYYSAVKAEKIDKKFWPADVHVIGKDILWFHCVLWPCMLHAAEIPLPKQVYVHGMILAEDGRKMSKSLDNVTDPCEILEKYPCVDSFRYYLLRNIPAQSDGVFSEKDLVEKHNCELGNDYGNLIMRVIKLALKNLPPQIKGDNVEQNLDFSDTLEKMKEFMHLRQHNKALDKLWESVNAANRYINEKEPWRLKDDLQTLNAVLYNSCFAIHQLALLMKAFMPATSEKTLSFLGPSDLTWQSLKFGKTAYHLENPEPLFPRFDLKLGSD